jgi:hypothetical protein
MQIGKRSDQIEFESNLSSYYSFNCNVTISFVSCNAVCFIVTFVI